MGDTGTANTVIKPHLVKPHQMHPRCKMWIKVPGVKPSLDLKHRFLYRPEKDGVLVVVVLSDIPYYLLLENDALKAWGLCESNLLS